MTKLRTNRDMTREHHERLVAWVLANLRRVGMNKAELARALRIGDSNLRHSLGKKARKFQASEVEKMEKVFGVRFGDATPRKYDGVDLPSKSLPVVVLGQKIGHGFSEMRQKNEKLQIPPINLPRYCDTPQQAMPIEDDSANKYAPKGAYAIVVNYFDFRPSPQVGDKVVLKRYHPVLFRSGDLSQVENTVRIIEREGDRIILKSCSTSPLVKDVEYNSEDDSAVIAGLIIGWQFYEAY